MSKSTFGQVMAFSILVVPVLILSWFVIVPTSNGSNGGMITTIAGWVFGAILIAGLLYFASATAWKHRGKGAIAINGVKGFFAGKNGEGMSLKEKWDKKGPEGQRWFLYTALAVIAIFVAYLIPDGPDGNGSYRYKIMGAIVLIGLHVVIWPFFTDKTSAVTKFSVSAFLIFCVVAFIFPNTADKTWKGVKNWATDFDDNYGKTPVASAQQSAIVPAVYQPEKRLDVLWLVPGDDFKEIPIPPGAKFNVECPPEAEALLYYRDAPRGKPYNCAEERVVASGVLDNLRIGFAIREIEDENGNMVPVTTEKVRIRVITEL